MLDEAGDFSLVEKYRLFSGNELHGNYSVSFQVAVTRATGAIGWFSRVASRFRRFWRRLYFLGRSYSTGHAKPLES